MARTRNIKPDFFDDEDLRAVDPDPGRSRTARLLFAGLWTQADKAGRLEDRPTRLKLRLLPLDEDISAEDVDALLSALARGRFIIRYAVNGHRLIQIRTFQEHQYLSKHESESSWPPPPPDPPPDQTHISTVPVSDSSQTSTPDIGLCTRTQDTVCGIVRARERATAPRPSPREDGSEDAPEATYQQFRQRAGTVLSAHLPLTPRSYDAGSAIEFCQRYPDQAVRYGLIDRYLASTHKPIRGSPPTLGQVCKWAAWLEAQPRELSDDEFVARVAQLSGEGA